MSLRSVLDFQRVGRGCGTWAVLSCTGTSGAIASSSTCVSSHRKDLLR